MKKIAMLYLAIILSITSCAYAQQIDNILPKNHGGMLQPLMEGTFDPDRPTDVTQDFISYAMGTDVRSTSLRTDRPTDVTQDFISYAMGTDWLTCGDNDITKRKVELPLSIPADTDSCANAFGAVFLWEQNMYNLDSAYDTMQWYIRHCYLNANSSQTWGGYQGSWNTVVYTQAGRDSIFNFVLYALGLRSDDQWFCDGVPLLGIKYGNGQLPNYGDDRAIFKFLMDNPRCAWNYINDSIEYAGLLMGQWNLWADTSQPGSVFDSTVPTLQSLGLDTLLVINGQASVTFALPTPPIINSASITENPFDNSTSIALSVGREAYITIAVYNVLGQQIAGAGYAGVFEQGNATVPVNMTNAPPGTYLVRISTANNETQTLKLTKE